MTVAPAHGLTLVAVGYPDDPAEYAHRADAHPPAAAYPWRADRLAALPVLGPARQSIVERQGVEAVQEPRRGRDLGIVVGTLPTGPLNAVTDVPGVRVGHTTLVEGDSIRSGVTAIVPDQLTDRRSLPAELFVGNGHGKMVGSTQVAELGEIETPVVLTATLSTFRAADALGHVHARAAGAGRRPSR